MSRSRPQLVVLLSLALVAGCGGRPSSQEQVALREQQRFLARCRAVQSQLTVRLDSFHAAERRLEAIRAELFPASEAPPPLDPEEQRRLTQEDQQTEQELHDQAVAAWREQEALRRERWLAERQVRQQQAVADLEAAAGSLQALAPSLLLSGSGAGAPSVQPRLDQQQLQRWRTCAAEPLP